MKISPGIIARLHHTDRRPTVLPKEQCARVKKGTSAVLLQSGLVENWWADSMECFTSLRNVQDLLSDQKTSYERRFGKPFKGPIIPYGSLVEYFPISAKDQSRIRQFGKKVLPGLFLGYALYAGGIWKGDTLVADIEELETMETQCRRGDISQREWTFYFSSRRWTNQTSIRGESHVDFLGESERVSSTTS